MLKKISLLVCVFNFVFCFTQNIEDVNGNTIKYRKVGNLYWSDNISTTKMWSTKRKLTLVQSAPMPDVDYGGGYIIDQNSKPIYTNRYYLNYDGNYYYTWNTANNFTAFKEITNQTKKFNQIPNANLNVSNSSICPCGWRVPSVDDVSDLLVSLKVFNSKEEFKNWIYDKGLFDSKFLFNPSEAFVIKEDINPSTLENKLFVENEFDGIFGMQGSDKNKPLKKDEMFSIWLSNIGAIAGTEMQIEGLGLYIAKKNNKLSLIIKPFMSSQMMSVKCVSDDNGLKKYEEWRKNQKVEIEEEKNIESAFDSLLKNNEFKQSYEYLKSNFQEDLPTVEKWNNSDQQMNDFFEAIGRGEIKKVDGVDIYVYGRCDKYFECNSGRQENSSYCKGHNEKVKNESLNLSTKLYNKWNEAFNIYVSNLIDNLLIEQAKIIIEFYSNKEIYVNKQEEINKIKTWNYQIAFIENRSTINKLKKKALSELEGLFIGRWSFESKNINLKNGNIIKMEEEWIVNSDRTYNYSSKFKNMIDKTYFGDYTEKGVFEISAENNLITLVAHIMEEKGKPSIRIDNMKFDDINEKKASRTLIFTEAKAPAKLNGKKL
jgi:hypothetical protein